MNDKKRIVNSLLNGTTDVIGQMISMLLGFVVRTVFIYCLGEEFLGINGLIQNILSVLCIADLGLESAIVFSLYRPLAENDTVKVNIIMSLYKRSYFIIGSLIFLLGILLVPILPFLLKESTDLVNINLIYVFFLFDTVSGYWFFAYRKTILVADQKAYKTSIVLYTTRGFASVLQIVELIVLKNFYFYVIIGIASNVVSNIIAARIAIKEYPFLKQKTKEKLPKEEKMLIKKNIIGSFIYKVSEVGVNSTDNIIISVLIGVAVVGKYSNYLLIISYIQLFINKIFDAFTASVGNLYVKENSKKNKMIFDCLNFLDFWIYGISCILYFVLINPFIELWIGKTYLLDEKVIYLVFFNLLVVGLQRVVKTYRGAYGLFWKGRIRPILTLIVNLVVSVVIGMKIGLAGVILGTIVSNLTTIFWYEPILIYKNVFECSAKEYFVKYIFNFILISFIAIGLYFVFRSWLVSWITLFARAIISFVLTNIIFFLIYGRSEEFKYLKNVALRLITSKIKRNKKSVG